MSFQTKLLLTYSLLIILLVLTLGVFFYRYSSGLFEVNAYSNLKIVSDKMSKQLDNLIHPMDLITTYLLSTNDFISSMTSLSTLDRKDPRNMVYNNAGKQMIQSNICTYAIDRNFYRVSVFNDNGDFLTSNFRTQNVDDENQQKLIKSLPWLTQVVNAKGNSVILPPYEDPWTISDKTKVFGLMRCIQGPRGGMGYIEVQTPNTELEKIFSVPSSDSIEVVAITDQGKVFYNNGITDNALLEYYSDIAASIGKNVSMVRNPLTGKDEIVAVAGSDYTGIRIVLAQDKNALIKPLIYTYNATFSIGILILIVSLGYVFIFSRQLARPIRQLKKKMEDTELVNLPEKLTFDTSNNEIKALNSSFQRLRERLNEAVNREIKSHTLQIQANFDSLQAQVNPHFIYNILNVLSNKGLDDGDDDICEICDSIASMLRYSTSTLKRTATIGEELEHVGNYLLLMKKRFEHRLEYHIDVDPAIFGETIPKIVLQQIVENSINHGFDNLSIAMRIGIRGYLSGEWWYIEITDNGQGFDPIVLCKLEERMKSVKEELSSTEPRTGFSIGGMGLVNTYARMTLFYNGKFVFKMENIDDRGAKVTIGCALGIKEGGGYVEDCPGGR